jgi:hypothetical protein
MRAALHSIPLAGCAHLSAAAACGVCGHYVNIVAVLTIVSIGLAHNFFLEYPRKEQKIGCTLRNTWYNMIKPQKGVTRG